VSGHLLVIGAQRSGTTYLHRLLDAHPEITMARPARPEPKVFLSDELTARGGEWYRRHYFAHADGERMLGEKSTSYIEDPLAPSRAAKALGSLGEVHVVALLRDPVDRAVSNWRFSVDNGLESRPLEEALRAGLAGTRPPDTSGASVSPFAYLERGRYAEHLGPWLATFPATTHVLHLSDLLDDEAALAGLYADLGVDPTFRPPDRAAGANESRAPAPTLSPQLLAELRQYFHPADQALAALLGRDIPWATPTDQEVSRG
jgi:hypothetical protein